MEEKEGLVGQNLIEMYTAGQLPQLRSDIAQAALVTIAEQLVSPVEVRKVVINEMKHSGGSTDNVGIKALDLALKHATRTQEDIIEIVNDFEMNENELE